MSTERFPARVAGTLVCGHPTACMYRWLGTDRKSHKYCMACLFEKSGLKDLDAVGNEMREKEEKLAKKPAEPAKVEPITVESDAKIVTPPKKVKKDTPVEGTTSLDSNKGIQ